MDITPISGSNEQKQKHYRSMGEQLRESSAEQGQNLLADELEKWEPLIPELQQGLYASSSFGQAVNTKFVIEVPYMEAFNYRFNRRYRMIAQEAQKALAEKDWGRYVFLHERPYRFEALYDAYNEHVIDNKTLAELFSSCWTDTENMWQVEWMVEILANEVFASKSHMMDKRELEFLDSLPAELFVYRGYSSKGRYDGMSWTLSYWRAKWFSQRYTQSNDDQFVARALCDKENVIGCFFGRGEQEIAVRYNDLWDVDRDFDILSNIQRSFEIQRLRDRLERQYRLRKDSYHGTWHWDKVEMNALAMAAGTQGADPVVCQLFAILHDSQRQDEGHDPGHGARAAEYVVKLYDDGQLPINEEQLKKLSFACRYHNDGSVSKDATIGSCWDADRLDLIRVDILPKTELLSTQFAKDNIWRI